MQVLLLQIMAPVKTVVKGRIMVFTVMKIYIVAFCVTVIKFTLWPSVLQHCEVLWVVTNIPVLKFWSNLNMYTARSSEMLVTTYELQSVIIQKVTI
jgi:hypothetical protein